MTEKLLTPNEQYQLQIIEDLNKPRGLGKKVGLKYALHPSQIEDLKALYVDGKKNLFLACGRKYGKMLDLDTPILTPSGFKRNGDLKENDELFDENGQIQKVLQVHDIKTSPEAFRVYFDNGDYIDACADHRWYTWTKKDRKNFARGLNYSPKVRNTKEIFESLMDGKEYNHSIPFVKPINFPKKELSIDPYVLGVWLGDGCKNSSTITNIDEDLINHIKSLGYEINSSEKCNKTHTILGLISDIKKEGLYKNKHIPNKYLFSSIEQRTALLQGLLDTDGYCSKSGNIVEFCNTNKDLAEGVRFLASSLGLNASIREKQPKQSSFKNKPKLAYIVSFHPQGKELFKIKRKQERVVDYKKTPHRTIVNVERIPSKPMRCITVSGDSHLYLAGDTLTPTHNTELAAYALWKQALTVPNSECFYVTPEAVGGRKIIWEGGRLQRFLEEDSKKYIASIRNQDMTIKFKNGSYIQVVGSDNYMVANGLTPSIAVYDEFKGFNPRWHIEFAPNRIVKDAPFVFIGTKPRAGNKNMDQYNEILKYAKENPDRWYAVERSTFDNPINNLPHIRSAIEEEIRQLEARGDHDVVQLEYYSKEVLGGKRSIFPILSQKDHVLEHNELYERIKKDLRNLDWYVMADPASTTCFAMLFAAINPYTNEIFLLDEIYEKSQKYTSTKYIVPRCFSKQKELYPNSDVNDDWYKAYDDAAAWFSTEALSQYQTYFAPAQKWRGDKEDGLSIIKDALVHKKLFISSRCENLFEEMSKYALDDKGKIPKKNDHLIDCLRYLLIAANYDFQNISQEVERTDPLERLFFGDGLDNDKDDDWINNIGDW